MMISVDVHNTDLGTARDVTDVVEQVRILCTAIAHADQSDGAAVRALTTLAYELAGGDATEGARLLLGAAAIAAHGIGVDIDEAMEVVEDNMTGLDEIASLNPRTS